MSKFDYVQSGQIAAGEACGREPAFDALIMAAMRRADTRNEALLAQAFPELWTELRARYNAPGGVIVGDPFVCPVCGRTSHNPNDLANGYCGHCHAHTAPPVDV